MIEIRNFGVIIVLVIQVYSWNITPVNWLPGLKIWMKKMKEKETVANYFYWQLNNFTKSNTNCYILYSHALSTLSVHFRIGYLAFTVYQRDFEMALKKQEDYFLAKRDPYWRMQYFWGILGSSNKLQTIFWLFNE